MSGTRGVPNLGISDTWTRSFFVARWGWGAVVCMLGCWAISLASAHYQQASCAHPQVWRPKMSSDILQRERGGLHHPQWRNTELSWKEWMPYRISGPWARLRSVYLYCVRVPKCHDGASSWPCITRAWDQALWERTEWPMNDVPVKQRVRDGSISALCLSLQDPGSSGKACCDSLGPGSWVHFPIGLTTFYCK